jgi:hypothetical protein
VTCSNVLPLDGSGKKNRCEICASQFPERKFWRKWGGNGDIATMKRPTQPNKPEHREQKDIPPNLAKRIQEVEVEMMNGLLLTHEDVLERITTLSNRISI